jgi:hypothetical protein
VEDSELATLKTEVAETFYKVFQEVEGKSDAVKRKMAELLVEMVIDLVGSKL